MRQIRETLRLHMQARLSYSEVGRALKISTHTVDWYMNGKIEIDPMITHVLTLEEINKGFDLMHEGKSIRSVVHY